MRFAEEFKRQIRNKTIFFWTGIFPLLLSVLFFLVLQGAYSSETIHVHVAVIEGENKEETEAIAKILNGITYQGEPLYEVRLASEEEALELLDQGEVSGVLCLEDGALKVKLEKNGFSQTLITEFAHQYEVNRQVMTEALQSGMSMEEAMELVEQKVSIHFQATIEKDPGALHFFTLIGMVCMYGGFYGIRSMKTMNANMSYMGLRVNASGYPKYKLVLSNFIINNLILDSYVTVDVLFMRYALGVDFGEHLLFVLLLAYLGCFAGNGFGLVLGGMFPNMGNDAREGILIAVSMLFSFFSGMMSIAVKQLVMEHLKIMTYINPCYLITDGLYSLFYYGAHERYFHNLLLLLIFGIVSTAIGLMMTRGRSYESL